MSSYCTEMRVAASQVTGFPSAVVPKFISGNVHWWVEIHICVFCLVLRLPLHGRLRRKCCTVSRVSSLALQFSDKIINLQQHTEGNEASCEPTSKPSVLSRFRSERHFLGVLLSMPLYISENHHNLSKKFCSCTVFPDLNSCLESGKDSNKMGSMYYVSMGVATTSISRSLSLIVMTQVPKVSKIYFSKLFGGSFKKCDFPVGSTVAILATSVSFAVMRISTFIIIIIAKCANIAIPIENVWSTVHFLVCRYFPVSAHPEVLSHTCYRTPKGHYQILLLYPLGQLIPCLPTFSQFGNCLRGI